MALIKSSGFSRCWANHEKLQVFVGWSWQIQGQFSRNQETWKHNGLPHFLNAGVEGLSLTPPPSQALGDSSVWRDFKFKRCSVLILLQFPQLSAAVPRHELNHSTEPVLRAVGHLTPMCFGLESVRDGARDVRNVFLFSSFFCFFWYYGSKSFEYIWIEQIQNCL